MWVSWIRNFSLNRLPERNAATVTGALSQTGLREKDLKFTNHRKFGLRKPMFRRMLLRPINQTKTEEEVITRTETGTTTGTDLKGQDLKAGNNRQPNIVGQPHDSLS
jgi:hypothetical protein